MSRTSLSIPESSTTTTRVQLSAPTSPKRTKIKLTQPLSDLASGPSPVKCPQQIWVGMSKKKQAKATERQWEGDTVQSREGTRSPDYTDSHNDDVPVSQESISQIYPGIFFLFGYRFNKTFPGLTVGITNFMKRR